MIYGKSTHPVIIRKIPIEVWTLRDEIESQIEAVQNKGLSEEQFNTEIKKISKYYELTPKLFIEVLEEKTEESSTDNSEDAETNDENESESESEDNNDEQEDGDSESTSEGEESENENEISKDSVDNNSHELEAELKNIEKITRIEASDDKKAFGFCFLSDIAMESILIFLSENYLLGQTIIVKFLTTVPFSISCKLIYTKDIAMTSRIISPTKPKYRLQLDNLLQYPEERKNLREFLKSIEIEIPKETKKPVKAKSDDDDLDIDNDLDDFSDFGFDE